MDTGMSASRVRKSVIQPIDYARVPIHKRSKPEQPTASFTPAVPGQYSKLDTLFVNDDAQAEALLIDLQQGSASSCDHVILVRTPEDLQQDGLRQRITINDDGTVGKQLGLLVESPDNHKVTLVVDFRQFEPSQYSSLNSLFDSPPRLDRVELGGHVRIIALVNKDLFPSHKSQTWKAGQDFSVRMARGYRTTLAQGQSFDKQSGSVGPVQALLNQQVPEGEAPRGRLVYTMDLSCGDWQDVLFGRADIDEQGRQYYRRGLLADVDPGEALVVKGAPWHDPGFRYALYTIIHTGQYYANGRYQTLPEDIVWCRQPVTADDIKQRKKCIEWASQPEPNQAIINSDNLALVLRKNRLSEQGTLVRHDSFPEYLNGCSGIRITSPLTTQQWMMLLSAVQAVGLKSVPVYLDTPRLQPSQFQGPEPEMGERSVFFQPAPPICSHLNSGNKCITLIQGADAPCRYRSGQGAESMDTGTPSFACELSDHSSLNGVLNIVVTPDLSLTHLLEHLRLVSLHEARFERQELSFVSALKTGRTVRMRGLESNPTLARQLESLLASPPTLIVNGQKQTFAHCHLEVYWPLNTSPESLLWREALEAIGEQPEISTAQLKQWFKDTFHGTDQDAGIVDCVEQLKNLVNAYVPANQQLSLNQDLLSKLVIQAQREKLCTGERQLSGIHWRKAINSILLKSYRNDRELYSFFKLAVRAILPEQKQQQERETNWLDDSALREWLREHPNPDVTTLQQHFWQLTRYLGCPVIDQLPRTMVPGQGLLMAADSEPFQVLARQLVKAAGQPRHSPLLSAGERKALQERLQVQQQDPDGTIFFSRNLRTEKQMQDFYYELEQPCSQRDIQRVASVVGLVINSQQSVRQKQEVLKQTLRLYNIPPGAVQSLVELLLDPDNPTHWQHWYARRKARLKAKVEQHPVTLVTGEPGTGKSFMAAEVAKTLQGGGPVQVISCGPQTRLSDLMVKETLVRNPETGEAEVIQTAGPLRQWADKKATKEQPAVIVIDEANLCDPAVWNGLKGIYEPEPYITDQHGHPIPITTYHRIIMTGNPLSMIGRRLNRLLKDRAPELFFRPLNDPFMASQIVRPALETVLHRLQQQGVSVDIKATQVWLNSAVMALFNQYKRLIPDHEFSPRDLTDFNSRILSYFNTACEVGLDKRNLQPLDQALAGLVWQGMADSLAGLVKTGIRWQLEALQTWYRVTFGLDQGLTEPHQRKFEAFFDRWLAQQQKAGADFNLANQSVRELARVVWLELDRLLSCCFDQAETMAQFRGRCATVIEGPAGRGKDDLVKRLVHEWNRQQQEAGKTTIPMRAVTLDPNYPDPFYQILAQTSSQGEIMIGSEMNLLKSQYHEGQMNDLLTGGSAPGFHLFATVNPATFVGRHRFSNALNSRCNQILIGDYNRQDLENIAGTLFPCHPHLAQRVAEWHWQLKSVLQSRSIPQSPTVGDMKRLGQTWLASLSEVSELDSSKQLSVAMDVGSIPSETDDEQRLKRQFEETYGFYFQFLSSDDNPPPSLEEIERLASQPLSALEDSTRNLNRWTAWLHKQVPAMVTRPVCVIAGPESSYDASSGLLILRQALLDGTPGTGDKQIEAEIIRLIIQERWQRYLPLSPPYGDDILFSAAYRYWQQKIAKSWFIEQPQWAEQAEQVFPLSQEEQHTLSLTNNNFYFDALQKLVSLVPANHSLAIFARTLFSPLTQLEGDLQTDQAEIPAVEAMDDSMAELLEHMSSIDLDSLPPVEVEEVEPYRQPEARLIEPVRYFDRTTVIDTRRDVCNAAIRYTAQGSSIQLISVPAGTQGYEVIIPALNVPKTMAIEEDSGAFTLLVNAGQEQQWQSIPGIAPQQKLFALESDLPAGLEVIRDRATHQHYVRPRQPVAPGSYLVKFGIREQRFAVPPNLDNSRDTIFQCAVLTDALAVYFQHDQQFQWLRDLQGEDVGTALATMSAYFRRFSLAPDPGDESRQRDESRQLSVKGLLRHLKLNYGSCRYRALGFQAMATWLGIPSRIITSKNYTYVEASKNRGCSWESYNLGNVAHPEQKVREAATPFTKIEAGIAVKPEVRRAMLALSQDGRVKLADATGVTRQQLESWLMAGENAPIPLNRGKAGAAFRDHLSSLELTLELTARILNRIDVSNQETNRELVDLAIALLLSLKHRHLALCCSIFDQTVQAVLSLASGGQHALGLLCQALTELSVTADDKDKQKDFQHILNNFLNALNYGGISVNCPSDAQLQLVAFITLDNNWISPAEQPAWFHALADSTIYGERARLKLDGWYEHMNHRLDCAKLVAPAFQKTMEPSAELLASVAIAGRGYSRSLEARLKVRGSVQNIYGWQVTNQLSSDRLVRRQPCFQRGAESVTLPPVVMVIPLIGDALERAVNSQSWAALRIPVDQATGDLDSKRVGCHYQVSNYGQQGMAFQELSSKWPDVFPVGLLCHKDLPTWIDCYLNDNHAYQRLGAGEKTQLHEALQRFCQIYVAPAVEFASDSIPLFDILQTSFYDYLFETSGARTGNVKVLHPGTPTRRGKPNNAGFFQPTTRQQWQKISASCDDGADSAVAQITPELLQRNGRFDQAAVITRQEVIVCWREFVQSFDLEAVKGLCVVGDYIAPARVSVDDMH